MVEMKATSYVVKLYLSGPIDIAKQIIRDECMRDGLCVTIEPTLFIYTGGEEAGYVVGLLNYPRFPSSHEAIYSRAKSILLRLLDATFQHSGLLVAPDVSEWVSKRS